QTGGWTQDVLVARSDAAGRYAVTQAATGASLGARAAGYRKSEIVDLDLVDRTMSPVSLELRLNRGGGQIVGIVRSSAGEPIPGAIVVAGTVDSTYQTRSDQSIVERWSAPRVRTSEDGRFDLVGLDPGEVAVYAAAWDLETRRALVTVEEGETSELELILGLGATLEGVVLGLDGQPVEGATVRVFEERLNERFLQGGQVDYDGALGYPAARTDADGRYRVERVAAGPCAVYAMGRIGPHEWKKNRVVPYVREDLVISEGEVRRWDTQLSEGRTIEGVVTYSDGTPMEHLFVNLRSESGEGNEWRALDTVDGTFRFIQLEDTTYEARAQIWNLPHGAKEPRVTGLRPGNGPVQLVAEFPPPVKTEPSRVRIRVEHGGDIDASHIGVELQRRDGHYSWNTGRPTDEPGLFTFDVSTPGRYGPQVLVGERIVWLGEEIDLAGGEDLDLGTVRINEGGSLRFVIRYPDKGNPHDVGVRLSPEGSWGSEALDIEGQTELVAKGLLPAKYSVRLTGEGVVWRDFEVEVRAEETTTLELNLVAAVQVPYWIGREQPEPATSLAIRLIDRDSREVLRERELEEPHRYANPIEWSYWLAPGHYTLEAERGTGEMERQDFDVTSLNEADLPEVKLEFR
ncbi:MAG: carboxypeptidase-like regulatory domain-containing protein, partial [Planctomycetota bacterium]